MTFLMIALLPATVALCLLVALAVSVLVRSVKGERWAVPLEGPLEGLEPVTASGNLQVNPWLTDGLAGGLVRESVA